MKLSHASIHLKPFCRSPSPGSVSGFIHKKVEIRTTEHCDNQFGWTLIFHLLVTFIPEPATYGLH